MAATLVQCDPHNRKLLEELEPGDLIKFPRGVYSHWAIYIGNEEVVHLTGEGNDGINGQFRSGHVLSSCGKRFDKALVKIDNFWDVVRGCKARKNNSKDWKWIPFSPEQTVQRAMSCVGAFKYNLFTHNCEHFANFCRYGIRFSSQVCLLVALIVLIIIIFAAVLVGKVRAKLQKQKVGKAEGTPHTLTSRSTQK